MTFLLKYSLIQELNWDGFSNKVYTFSMSVVMSIIFVLYWPLDVGMQKAEDYTPHFVLKHTEK